MQPSEYGRNALSFQPSVLQVVIHVIGESQARCELFGLHLPVSIGQVVEVYRGRDYRQSLVVQNVTFELQPDRKAVVQWIALSE